MVLTFSIRMLGIFRGFAVWGFKGLGGSMVCIFFWKLLRVLRV